MGRNVLDQAMARFAQTHAMRRRGRDLFKVYKETIIVVNLQRSNFGNRYFINVGVYLREEADATLLNPSELDCQIRARLDSQLADRKDFNNINAVLDLEVDIPDGERVEECVRLLDLYVGSQLASLSSIDALRSDAGAVFLERSLISLRGRRYLGLPMP